MTCYAVVIEQAEGNLSDSVGDLAGCVSTGASLYTVQADITEARQLHVGLLTWTSESNNLHAISEMSASEASTSFSAVLDAAEHGDTIVVTRSGQRVALIAPALRANGAALRKVLRRWQDNPALDDDVAARVSAAATAASAELDSDPWRA